MSGSGRVGTTDQMWITSTSVLGLFGLWLFLSLSHSLWYQ